MTEVVVVVVVAVVSLGACVEGELVDGELMGIHPPSNSVAQSHATVRRIACALRKQSPRFRLLKQLILVALGIL